MIVLQKISACGKIIVMTIPCGETFPECKPYCGRLESSLLRLMLDVEDGSKDLDPEGLVSERIRRLQEKLDGCLKGAVAISQL